MKPIARPGRWWGWSLLAAVLALAAWTHLCAAERPVAQPVADALRWLSALQREPGDFPATAPLTGPYQRTARVAQVLAGAFPGSQAFAGARGYLAASPRATTEARARYLLVADSAADLAALEAARNADGGFGAQPGYGSNVLDTALAVAALKRAGAPFGRVGVNRVIAAGGTRTEIIDLPADVQRFEVLVEGLTNPVQIRIGQGAAPGPTSPYYTVTQPRTSIVRTAATTPPLTAGKTWVVISAPADATLTYRIDYAAPSGDTAPGSQALAWLLAAQNVDFGWGFLPADADSRLYDTYWALRALGDLVAGAGVTAFIQSRARPGGGFSDRGPADLFDTAVALTTLTLLGEDPNLVAAASVERLESAQQSNGGFADDPFVTAWAMDALLALAPPLAPLILSDGGAGAGTDFVTDSGTLTVSGLAPVGAVGVQADGPVDAIAFDQATGVYTLVLRLVEGANTVRVRARGAGGLLGEPRDLAITLDSSLAAQSIAVTPGLNPVGFYLDPANALNARRLLDLLGPGAAAVQRLDPATGRYERLARAGTGDPVGVDFPIQGLDAVQVFATAAGTARIAGRAVDPAVVDLVAGVNTLTIPNPPPGLAASALLRAIGDASVVSAVQRFVPESGRFQVAGYQGQGIVGSDFPVRPGAYLVHMRRGVVGFALPAVGGPTIAITTPAAGAVVTRSPVAVGGSISGTAPLAVTVNGLPALVQGTSYSAAVLLAVAGPATLTAVVRDGSGLSGSATVNVLFDPVDYGIRPGDGVSGERTFSAAPELLARIAHFTQTFVALPAGFDYRTTSVRSADSGVVTVGWSIAVAANVAPGLYRVEVEYGLLDANSNPLVPLTGNRFIFRIEVTP